MYPSNHIPFYGYNNQTVVQYHQLPGTNNSVPVATNGGINQLFQRNVPNNPNVVNQYQNPRPLPQKNVVVVNNRATAPRKNVPSPMFVRHSTNNQGRHN